MHAPSWAPVVCNGDVALVVVAVALGVAMHCTQGGGCARLSNMLKLYLSLAEMRVGVLCDDV